MSGGNNVVSLLKQLLQTSNKYDSRALGMVLSETEFATVLEKERLRSDRLAAPFSLVVIPADINNAKQLQKLASFIKNNMRVIDEFGWYNKDHLALLMFDTTFEGARSSLKRLDKLADSPKELHRAAVHVYPDAREDIYKENANLRRRERLDMELSAQLVVSSGEAQQPGVIQVLTQDISSQGAFLVTSKHLDEGTEVILDINLPLEALNKMTGSVAKLHATGRVVRTANDGVAVQFTEECAIPPLESILGTSS